MDEKITKYVCTYKEGFEPNYILPEKYCSYRFALGKTGENPLVVICMNPSAAKETFSDKTINRIIKISEELEMDGWIVFNLYPERATNADLMEEFNEDLANKNIEIISEFLTKNKIREVWGAWGNDNGIKALIKGKQMLTSMLLRQNIRVFYFGTLTKQGNPRHPLQRFEKWDLTKKQYLSL